MVPELLSFVIQSNSFVERLTAYSVGIAYPAIAETRLGSFPVAIPTSGVEQLNLVEYIKTETRSIDEAIRRSQRGINLIQEYRTRLIADVVTGKLDVRGVELSELGETPVLDNFDERDESADLPEETDEVETIEEEDGH